MSEPKAGDIVTRKDGTKARMLWYATVDCVPRLVLSDGHKITELSGGEIVDATYFLSVNLVEAWTYYRDENRLAAATYHNEFLACERAIGVAENRIKELN